MKFPLTFLMSCLLASWAFAQELPASRSPQYNERSSEGVFDLLVHVDGEAILYVRNTEIGYLLLSGVPLRDAGSNYSQPVPQAVFGSFNMEKKAGRGTATLVEEANAKNNYTAVVRINDRGSGADFYHIRLAWVWNPADPSRAPGGRNSERLESRRNDPGDYNRGREGNLEFRGRVDDVIVLRVRSDQVRVELISGRPLRGERFRFSQPLPSVALKEIQLTEIEGRAQVELLERPYEGNRYSAVIRITDPRSGDGEYSFKLVWRR